MKQTGSMVYNHKEMNSSLIEDSLGQIPCTHHLGLNQTIQVKPMRAESVRPHVHMEEGYTRG